MDKTYRNKFFFTLTQLCIDEIMHTMIPIFKQLYTQESISHSFPLGKTREYQSLFLLDKNKGIVNYHNIS